MDAVAEALAAPAERGTLDVRAKAVERLAEGAALEIPGSVRHASRLGALTGSLTGPLTGSTHPKATVRISDGSARVDVAVACVWPAPLARIAAQVRERVAQRTAELSGISIISVDVTVTAVDADDLPTTTPTGRTS